MLDSLKQLALNHLFFLLFFTIGLIGLWFSPFLVSLSTIFILFYTLWLRFKNKVPIYSLGYLILVPLVFVLTDYFRSTNTVIVTQELLLVIGLAILFIGFFVSLNNASKLAHHSVIIVLILVAIVNIYSVSNYYSNKEMYDTLLLQSKAIPVLNMHHIHFGIVNAFSIILIGKLLYYQELKSNTRKLYYVVGAIIIICFHILSSRTGLVAFYSGVFVSLLLYTLKSKRIKTLLIAITAAAVLLVSVYSLSTSFRNKVSNSIEDFTSLTTGKDKNYKSLTMRVEAYKASIRVIKSNFILGVGSSEMKTELQIKYDELETELNAENRVGPHNQILEYGMKYGIFGILWVVLFCIVLLRRAYADSYFSLAAIIMLIVALQFESLLERQASIYFVSFFTAITLTSFNRKNPAI